MEKGIHTETLPNGLSFDMIYVEGGSFEMGGVDEGAYDDEKPIHTVSVPSFYIGKYPVTQVLWEAVMGENPSEFQGSRHPVETVSWEDVQQFIQQLNQETDKPYRLPSEAEWEFAARGGIHSEGYVYAGSDKLKEVGWYNENAENTTHPVGQKMANELGIYDLSGNVEEWCADDWNESYKGAPVDASVWVDTPSRGEDRVVRGGNWFNSARGCRVSYRDRNRPVNRVNIVGFRLVQ